MSPVLINKFVIKSARFTFIPQRLAQGRSHGSSCVMLSEHLIMASPHLKSPPSFPHAPDPAPPSFQPRCPLPLPQQLWMLSRTSSPLQSGERSQKSLQWGWGPKKEVGQSNPWGALGRAPRSLNTTPSIQCPKHLPQALGSNIAWGEETRGTDLGRMGAQTPACEWMGLGRG